MQLSGDGLNPTRTRAYLGPGIWAHRRTHARLSHVAQTDLLIIPHRSAASCLPHSSKCHRNSDAQAKKLGVILGSSPVDSTSKVQLAPTGSSPPSPKPHPLLPRLCRRLPTPTSLPGASKTFPNL